MTAKVSQEPGTPLSWWTPRLSSRTGAPATRVADSAGDPDLARAGERGDPGSGMQRDVPDLAAGPVPSRRYAPRRGPAPQGTHAVADGLGAGDHPGRAVEQGQRAVTRGVHQPALVAVQLPADQLMEAVDQLPEPGCRRSRRPAGSTRHVDEQHGAQGPVRTGQRPHAGHELLDGIQHLVGVAGEVEQAGIGKLDVLRAGDVISQVAREREPWRCPLWR